jgi:hypothetical protein
VSYDKETLLCLYSRTNNYDLSIFDISLQLFIYISVNFTSPFAKFTLESPSTSAHSVDIELEDMCEFPD